MGMTIKASDPYAGDLVIATCGPKSPAQLAGIKAGDKIVEIDGVKVGNQSELKHQLAPRYAGEKIALAVMRDDKRVEQSLELVAKLPPYIHPFLGILPRRDAALGDKEGDKEAEGVTVRYVYPDSPALKAGIELGDRIVSIAGEPVSSPQTLQDQIAAHEPLDTVKVELMRGGKSKTVEAKLATLPEAVPDELPPAHETKPSAGESKRRSNCPTARWGRFRSKFLKRPTIAWRTFRRRTTHKFRMGLLCGYIRLADSSGKKSCAIAGRRCAKNST